MSFSAVIVAAGSSTRAGPGAPKPWRLLGGRSILRWSVETLVASGVDEIVVVVASDRLADAEEALAGLKSWRAVSGGKTRAESVQMGLAALNTTPDMPVLIHDAARPFVTTAHIKTLLTALDGADGAIPVLPVADTLKRGDGVVTETVSREGLWRAQTPQAFRLGPLRDAYAAWPANAEPTDDAAVMELSLIHI